MRAFCLSSCPGMGRCVLLTEKRPEQPETGFAPTVFVVVTPLRPASGMADCPTAMPSTRDRWYPLRTAAAFRRRNKPDADGKPFGIRDSFRFLEICKKLRRN